MKELVGTKGIFTCASSLVEQLSLSALGAGVDQGRR